MKLRISIDVISMILVAIILAVLILLGGACGDNVIPTPDAVELGVWRPYGPPRSIEVYDAGVDGGADASGL